MSQKKDGSGTLFGNYKFHLTLKYSCEKFIPIFYLPRPFLNRELVYNLAALLVNFVHLKYKIKYISSGNVLSL